MSVERIAGEHYENWGFVPTLWYVYLNPYVMCPLESGEVYHEIQDQLFMEWWEEVKP